MKLKEGRTNYNEPRTEEAEKALVMTKVAKECGLFEPRREHGMLTQALGNPDTEAEFGAYPRAIAGRKWTHGNLTLSLTTRGRDTRKGSSRKVEMKQ